MVDVSLGETNSSEEGATDDDVITCVADVITSGTCVAVAFAVDVDSAAVSGALLSDDDVTCGNDDVMMTVEFVGGRIATTVSNAVPIECKSDAI